MGFRVTPSILFRSSLSNINRQRHALSLTQERAATGRQINRPSDDPTGAGAALLLRSGLGGIKQNLRNISSAQTRVASAEQSLSNSFDLLIRARELAIQGANGSQDASSRLQIAQEIEALHGSLVAEGNVRYGGGHLFAGIAADTAPFVQVGAFTTVPPGSPSVAFAGNSTPIEIRIDERELVPVAFDGRQIFLGDADGNGIVDAGREDLFDVLADLHDALAANDPTLVTASLARIDTGIDQLSRERTELGSVATRLELTEQRLLDRELSISSRISQLEDADLAEVIADLTQQESALQAGLGAMARLLQPTLLDFLG